MKNPLSVSKTFITTVLLLYCILSEVLPSGYENIPLSEHPRPDFMRTEWMNLNGTWKFNFDSLNVGEKQKWYTGEKRFEKEITVPFPWGAPLSGIKNEADMAWYKKNIRIPEKWNKKRVFLIIGASDYLTKVWVNGHFATQNEGGYLPFEVDITDYLNNSGSNKIIIRVDDVYREYQLYGKQGYGDAKGIWQTVYLEARPSLHFEKIHFIPDIDNQTVTIKSILNQPLKNKGKIIVHFKNQSTQNDVEIDVEKGTSAVEHEIHVKNVRLWSTEDPFLYDVNVELLINEVESDLVCTYFGMRKIHVMNFPGKDFSYVALNNQPVYLMMSLDQAYHPEGYYTFPSDEFMRDEILRSRKIGLNGQRIHVKIGIPRKLYWADKLGILIMADLPNAWGEPGKKMRKNVETTLKKMIERDFNHPSIFSWVMFNETWGLFTQKGDERVYLPKTQKWVDSLYFETKKLDPTRLVEDNSPCNYDHVNTDLNTWHAYLPGFRWGNKIRQFAEETYPGSGFNYADGYKQANQPMLNSECGNVWGYKGSTGDVDWSWDYHIMMNEFRKYPEVAGWLYTEHHDVVNEWNGYYKFDRSQKYHGMGDIVPEMTLNDLHAEIYVSLGNHLCYDIHPGENIDIPVWISSMTDDFTGEELIFEFELTGWNKKGNFKQWEKDSIMIKYYPWMNKQLSDYTFVAPPEEGLYVLRLRVKDFSGKIYHRNFISFLTENADKDFKPLKTGKYNSDIISFEPASFVRSEWSLKQWEVFDGLKINGTGSGYFEYEVPLNHDISIENTESAVLVMELSAKKLHGKDQEYIKGIDGDYMRGGGAADPSLNPNAYPMTDEKKYPSSVKIEINGHSIGIYDLPDDPADHRGIISWHKQEKEKGQDAFLHEAGSYGYLIKANIPLKLFKKTAKNNTMTIKLSVDDALPGGLAVYGEHFGRYPVAPSIILIKKQ